MSEDTWSDMDDKALFEYIDSLAGQDAQKVGIIGSITVRISDDIAIHQDINGEQTLVRWPR